MSLMNLPIPIKGYEYKGLQLSGVGGTGKTTKSVEKNVFSRRRVNGY
jgi:hypothetical protein